MAQRFALFTFRPQVNDTYLNGEFYNLLYPTLIKMKQFIAVKEFADTPAEHLHFVFPFNGSDKQKAKQKIEGKAITSFIKNTLQKTSTLYEHCFNYRMVENTSEDYMYTIGYAYKDGYELKSKGYTQQYITKCVQHYHAHIRAKAKLDPKSGWKVLNIKNAHTEIEHYALEHDLKIYDPELYISMRSNRISFAAISCPQRSQIHTELILSNQDKCEDNKFAIQVAKQSAYQHDCDIKDDYREDYIRLLTKLMEVKDMNEIRGFVETEYLRSTDYQYIK